MKLEQKKSSSESDDTPGVNWDASFLIFTSSEFSFCAWEAPWTVSFPQMLVHHQKSKAVGKQIIKSFRSELWGIEIKTRST